MLVMNLCVVRFMTKILLIVAFVLLTPSCVTFVDDPGLYRRNYRDHIGGGSLGNSSYSLNFLHHFGTNSGFVVAFEKELANEDVVFIESSTKSINPNVEDTADIRTYYQDSEGVSAQFLYFPFATSSFFVGCGAKYSKSQYAYDELTEGYSLTGQMVPVEWVSYESAATIPVGFSKNTTGHWSFVGGMRALIPVSSQDKFLTDGASRSIDIEARERTVNAIKDVNKVELEIFTAVSKSI